MKKKDTPKVQKEGKRAIDKEEIEKRPTPRSIIAFLPHVSERGPKNKLKSPARERKETKRETFSVGTLKPSAIAGRNG
jgi:hypothetical protein